MGLSVRCSERIQTSPHSAGGLAEKRISSKVRKNAKGPKRVTGSGVSNGKTGSFGDRNVEKQVFDTTDNIQKRCSKLRNVRYILPFDSKVDSDATLLSAHFFTNSLPHVVKADQFQILTFNWVFALRIGSIAIFWRFYGSSNTFNCCQKFVNLAISSESFVCFS